MDVNKITAMASRLSIPQLQQAMRDGSLPPYVGMPILQQKVKESQAMKSAQASGQPKPPSVAEQIEGGAQQASMDDMMRQRAAMMHGQMAQTGGISDMLRRPEPEPENMAVGGSVKRFAVGTVVPGLSYEQAMAIINNPTSTPEDKAKAQQALAQKAPQAPAQPQGLSDLYNQAIAQNPIVTAEEARKKREEFLGPNTGLASLREDVSNIKSEAAKDKEQAMWLNWMKMGGRMMAGPSPYALTNMGNAITETAPDFMEAQKDYRKALEKQRDLTYKLDAADRQEKMDVFNYGENSEKATKSANTALQLGKAKDEQEAKVKDAELALRQESNDISRTVAANTAAYQKGQLENNVYAQGRQLAEMQDKADALRSSGKEDEAAKLERQIVNRAQSFDMANPSIYGQSPEYKAWNNELLTYRSRANSIETALTNAQKTPAYTDEEKASKKAQIEQLQKEKTDWDKKIADHIMNKPNQTATPSGYGSPKTDVKSSTDQDATKAQSGQRSRTNTKGWNLMYSNGQYAYVNPKNPSEYEVVP